MMMNATTDYSCDEDELKCFELIAGHAKDNKEVSVVADKFGQEMEQEGIKPGQFDKVLSKMEDWSVAKREKLGGQEYIYINSGEVPVVKAMMEAIKCPSCKKPGIYIIKKRKCRVCKKEHDLE